MGDNNEMNTTNDSLVFLDVSDTYIKSNSIYLN